MTMQVHVPGVLIVEPSIEEAAGLGALLGLYEDHEGLGAVRAAARKTPAGWQRYLRPSPATGANATIATDTIALDGSSIIPRGTRVVLTAERPPDAPPGYVIVLIQFGQKSRYPYAVPQVNVRSDMHYGMAGLDAGLGVPGPYGRVPSQALDAGTYEISGTQVFLRDEPKLDSMDKGAFNAKYGPNSNIVVGEPDQVEFDAQMGNADGYSWAHVTATTGELAGQSGYVAAAYLAPVGWTKAQGKTSPTPSSPGGTGDDPKLQKLPKIAPADITTSGIPASWTTPVLIAAGVIGVGLVGYAIYKGSKKRGKAKARR